MTAATTLTTKKPEAATSAARPSLLGQLAEALASRRVRVVDLTQTLSPSFPQIALPPEMGQCWPFRIEEVSRYDERGPGWYWNNFSCGEHTGTHFDAPIHWISGRDLPNNSVDTISPEPLRGAGLRHRLPRRGRGRCRLPADAATTSIASRPRTAAFLPARGC